MVASADDMAAREAVPPEPDEADAMRAQVYALLGRLLARHPDADLLKSLGLLLGDDTALGAALTELGAAARLADPAALEREYHHLFIGVARGELVPFASYYITGFLNEKPLARLRQDMQALGIARADDVKEPEDHIASLCEMMAGLIAAEFAVGLERQQRFFDRHLAVWASRFFADLEKAQNASFYKAVGRVGRTFLAVEAEAFRLAA